MEREIRWAVLGVGVIANQMAEAMAAHGRKIAAVGNRTKDKADAFAAKYGIEKVYDDFYDMFTDPNIDAIYITTPHNTHYEFMKKAIQGGKHLLVEKSITLNSAELAEVLDLSAARRTVMAEAMTIYHMPLYTELRRRIESGEFGRVNLITVNFGSFKDYNMKNRFFNRSLAGGAMLDIGVYALSFARWFMNSKPNQIQSMMLPAPTGVDEEGSMLLRNPEGQLASIMLSLHSKQPKRGMVSCEKGYIEVMEFPRACQAVFTDAVTSEKTEILSGDTSEALYYELTDLEAAIHGNDSRLYNQETRDVMELMTEFRNTWGITYPEEEE